MKSPIFPEESRIYIFSLLALIFAVVLFRTAWLSDDAYIIFRTVLNFTHGFGPNFNITERVQAFTDPLWFFFITIAYIIVGNIFYAAFFVSIIFSIFAFFLIFKLSSSTSWAVIGSMILVLSKSFMEYGTSGLENPLSHFLLGIFVLAFIRQSTEPKRYLLTVIFLFSLIYLNRPDLVLLVLPMLAVAFRRVNRFKAVVFPSLFGFSPLLAWTVFSTIYYGFPFPNTAYAKLGTGIGTHELLLQGVQYYFDCLAYDPITLLIIFLGLILSIKSRSVTHWALSLGLVLYLAYILIIGGDFMSGRFFSTPLYAATLLLITLPRLNKTTFMVFSVLIVGFPIFHDIWFSREINAPNPIRDSGIADERRVYYFRRGLLQSDRNRFMDLPQWPSNGTEVKIKDVKVTCGGLGYTALYGGPLIHYVDNCGLSDPLLARLPALYRKDWRIGHFVRFVPTGYVESIGHSGNLLKDESLKIFYDRLKVITQSSIFSKSRFSTILKMNSAQYSHLINNVAYGQPPVIEGGITLSPEFPPLIIDGDRGSTIIK